MIWDITGFAYYISRMLIKQLCFTAFALITTTQTAVAQQWLNESFGGFVFNDSSGLSFDIYASDISGDGTRWFATSLGLFQNQGSNWTIVNTPNNYIGEGYAFAVDEENSLWYDEGLNLYRYASGNWSDVYDPIAGTSTTNVSVFGKDEFNRVWALCSSGIGSNYINYIRCLTDTLQPVVNIQNNIYNYAAISLFIRDTNIYIISDTSIQYISKNSGWIGQINITELIGGAFWPIFPGFDPGFRMSDDGRLIVSVLNSAYTQFFYAVDRLDATFLPLQLQYGIAEAPFQVIGNHVFGLSQNGLVEFDIESYSAQTLGINLPTLWDPLGGGFRLTSDGKKLYLYESWGSAWNGAPLYVYSYDPLASNRINGRVFIDSNGNGTMDVDEDGLQNQTVHLQPPTSQYAASNDTGFYSFFISDTSGSYVVSLLSPNSNWIVTTPSQTVNQTFAGQTTNVDFGIAPVSLLDDLAISVNSTSARPGMQTTFFIQVSNNGTQPYSGQLDVTLDNDFTYDFSTWTPTGNVGNTYSFNVPTIQPLGTAQLQIVATLSTSAVPGDSVYTTANVVAPADVNPSDNHTVYAKVITASFDPNVKEVSPTGFGSNNVTTAGTNLTYTIHFQNTGTDTAFNIVVRDTIASQYLDMSSFKLNAYSHPCQLDINGAGNIAFKFNNILLPDSNTNEPLSHGFVQYEIKVKDTAPNGSLVQNTAHIYFDYNAPVVTNTTNNLIGEPNAVREINVSYFNASPNPASDYLIIRGIKNGNVVAIYNTLGQSVLQNDLVENKLNVSSLAPGFYFVEVITPDGLVRSSFVKQ